MSFNRSISFEVHSEELSNFLKAIFGEPKKQDHTNGFSHPALVSVKSGDGIGFDAGNCVLTTSKKNNVGMLLKANYDNPFSVHENLAVSESPVLSKAGLVSGHTYMTEIDGETIFIKYLGHSMALVKTCRSVTIATITADKILPHYEISVPSPNSK